VSVVGQLTTRWEDAYRIIHPRRVSKPVPQPYTFPSHGRPVVVCHIGHLIMNQCFPVKVRKFPLPLAALGSWEGGTDASTPQKTVHLNKLSLEIGTLLPEIMSLKVQTGQQYCRLASRSFINNQFKSSYPSS